MRLDLLTQRTVLLARQVEAGDAAPHLLLEGREAFLRARMEMSNDPAFRRRALEEFVELAHRAEQLAAERVENGVAPERELLEARLRRVGAQIELERLPR
jgi:hypothetical protein